MLIYFDTNALVHEYILITHTHAQSHSHARVCIILHCSLAIHMYIQYAYKFIIIRKPSASEMHKLKAHFEYSPAARMKLNQSFFTNTDALCTHTQSHTTAILT